MKKIFLTFGLLFFSISTFTPVFMGEVLADSTAAVEEAGCTEADRQAGYCVSLSEGLGKTTKITGDDGIELISAYIGVIYRYIASLVGIICVAIIVVSGMQISLGGVSNEAVSNGKARIMNALLSLVLVFATGLILRTINPGFFVNDGSGTPESQEEKAALDKTPLPRQKPDRTPAAATTSAAAPTYSDIGIDGKLGNQTWEAYNKAPQELKDNYPEIGDGRIKRCDQPVPPSTKQLNCDTNSASIAKVEAFQREYNDLQ